MFRFHKLYNISKTHIKISTILLFVFFLLIAVRPVDDPDFGWHLKSGEYIAQNGWVPRTDIFSYTNSEHPPTNNPPLSDLIFYLLYSLGGKSTIFLILLYLGIAYLIFIYLLPKTAIEDENAENIQKTLLEDKLLAGTLVFLIISPLFFINPIVYDYLGFTLVLLIIEKYKIRKEKKTLWFIPLVFFFWPWLHGGFPIGFTLFGLMIFGDVIESFSNGDNKLIKTLKSLYFPITILAVSLAATLLNPYGFWLYEDILNVTKASGLVSQIQYWQPTYLQNSTFPFYIYFLCFFLFLVFSKFTLTIRHLLYIAFFASISFLAVRLYPFFILATMPVLIQTDKKNRINILLIIFAILLMALTNVVFYDVHNFSFFWPKKEIINDFISEKNIFYRGFPVEAFLFAKEKKIKGNMFNEFDWGGQLTWSLPDRKVFINGNMPHWQDKNGHKIFEDYVAIKGLKKNWLDLVDYYKIDWFFIEPNSSLESGLLLMPDRWEKIYNDERAVIFIKK